MAGVSVFTAWMMSLTTAGERVREMGPTEPLMSILGRSGEPVMVICMEQGRRIWSREEERGWGLVQLL